MAPPGGIMFLQINEEKQFCEKMEIKSVTCKTAMLLAAAAMIFVMMPASVSADADIETPQGFSAYGYTYNSVRIVWKKVSGASCYRIYRSQTASENYKLIREAAAETRNYTDRDLVNNRTYYYRITAVTSDDASSLTSQGRVTDAAKPAVKRPARFAVSGTGTSDRARISWSKTSDASYYNIYRAAGRNGKYIKIKSAGAASSSYTDSSRKKWGRYYYKLRAAKKVGLKRYYSSCTDCGNAVVKTPIMGRGSATAEKLASLYRRNAVYPSYYGHNSKDCSVDTIDKFCNIYIEECRAEGVRPEVAFCQAMLETGWLSYRYDVKRSQFNFAGIGATGGGKRGNSFRTVRLGIRAQVQHLKAYASCSGLNNPCVDPRYRYVDRGKCTYVEWLGIKENPYHGGWAAAGNYGYILMKIIKSV